MESIFLLPEGERSAYLQQMVQSFDCDYICLWSYLPQPSRCLLALDGLYRERRDQASSSAGSFAKRLFDVYKESLNYIDNWRIPGLAFKNNLPYMELKFHDLQRLSSNPEQLQFYQEAGIKTAVFMGCAVGEIELGMSNNPQVDLETEMKNMIFPLDFSQDPKTDPNQRPSSSSSSLRSLSIESPPEYSPLLFNINPTTTTTFMQEPLNDQTLNINTTTNQQSLGQIRNIQFPTKENEDDAMIKAILAVLSNPSSSQQQNLPPNIITHDNSNNPTTAFKRYIGGAAALTPINPTRKRNMFKRAVLFFRNLMNIRRGQELQMINQTGSRPNATQLHHMISERRRREKLNESFQILRSLLPPGSKKDKASVLSSTTEYLSALKSQLADLSKRNQMLESQMQRLEATTGDQIVSSIHSSVERTNQVEITQVSSSTSEARFLDVRVTVRGECSMLDLVIRIMELSKQQRSVSLMSVESNTRMIESIPVHEIMLRLKIEGHEFDESGFQEAVRRVVDDR